MLNHHLEEIDIELLREILSKQQPKLLLLLTSLGHTPLTEEHREELREALAAELCDTGLGENDEPNLRGIHIESLIDQLGHL
jgi:hypothetical protein